MTRLCVAGGRVLHPDQTITRADVWIDVDAGEISHVGPPESGPTADETLDAAGGLVMPGLVNAHTHAAMTLLRGYADDKPLKDWLREDIWPVEAVLEPADIRAGTELALLEMIRSGTTAFGDMYFEMGEVAAAVEDAGLRARLGHGVITVGKDDDAVTAEIAEALDVADSLDGRGEGRVRTAVMPHSLTTVDESNLRELADNAHRLGVPIHFHANETTDEVEPIVANHEQRPLAYAAELGLLRSDTWLAHGVHLEDGEIERLAERDSAVVHCPASNMKLASGAAPVPALRAADVTVALGTDGAASNNDLDMFDEMRDAAMLGAHAAGDAGAVPAEAVVEMATAGGADALGLPVGRVVEGAAADLAVLDLEAPHLTPHHELLSHLVYAARGSDVRHTICDGAVLMRDREVSTLDAVAVRERAETQAEELIARA
ncbi:MAG: amidohydrolase [Halobacteriaceae archaeon]